VVAALVTVCQIKDLDPASLLQCVASDADCVAAGFAAMAGARCPIAGVVQECRVDDLKAMNGTGVLHTWHKDVLNPCENFDTKTWSCSTVRSCQQ